MRKLYLFCDGSMHASSGRGYGAYLLSDCLNKPLTDLAGGIRTCTFANTSSTRLELQTLLHALQQTPAQAMVTVYTDSQNIIDLPRRRERLEAKNFCSGKGVRLNNADLYQQFFTTWDRVSLTLVKVRGHLPGVDKNRADQIFALVDKAARRCSRGALPRENKNGTT